MTAGITEAAIERLDRKPGCTSFEGMKIFSATKARDREKLGETVTTWMRAHPHFEIVDCRISQSSDSEFHCVTIALMYLILVESK